MAFKLRMKVDLHMGYIYSWARIQNKQSSGTRRDEPSFLVGDCCSPCETSDNYIPAISCHFNGNPPECLQSLRKAAVSRPATTDQWVWLAFSAKLWKNLSGNTSSPTWKHKLISSHQHGFVSGKWWDFIQISFFIILTCSCTECFIRKL